MANAGTQMVGADSGGLHVDQTPAALRELLRADIDFMLREHLRQFLPEVQTVLVQSSASTPSLVTSQVQCLVEESNRQEQEAYATVAKNISGIDQGVEHAPSLRPSRGHSA